MRVTGLTWIVVASLIASVAAQGSIEQQRCDLSVVATRAMYERDCLGPLDHCNAPDDGAWRAVAQHCPSMDESRCEVSYDCAWNQFNATGLDEAPVCAITRPATWRTRCGFNGQCPGTDTGTPCQAIFDTIVDACTNATEGDWPFPAERQYLKYMGCFAGPFMPNEGLDAFLAESQASVCELGVVEIAHFCACGSDEQGAQLCDFDCNRPDHFCQDRVLQWHTACCGGQNGICENSPMASIRDRLEPGPLDELNQICLTARAAETNPVMIQEDPIVTMCNMAWERIFQLVGTDGLNVCDWVYSIQTVYMVCESYVQLDATRIQGGYAIVEDPHFCSTRFTCQYNSVENVGDLIITDTCEDVDECLTANGGCSFGCLNNFGAPPTCTCPGGLQNPPACDICTDMCDCTLRYPTGSPCENGATCSGGAYNDFTCNCVGNFTGMYCETNRQQCDVGYNCPYVPTVPMRDGRGAYLLEPFAAIGLSTHSADSKVGVGTAHPRAKLDVRDKMKVEGDIAVLDSVNLRGIKLAKWEMDQITRLLEVYDDVLN